MASSLYATLRASVSHLVDGLERSRQTPPKATSSSGIQEPVPITDLIPQLQQAWQTAQQPSDGAQSSEINQIEVVRSVLELLGRDIVVSPVASGDLLEPADDASPAEHAAFQTSLQDRLDVVLTLFEVVYEAFKDSQNGGQPSLLEPGAIFIPLLEDLVELLSVDSWRVLWRWVETRSKRFTKDMPASRGKALPLLRIINAFLRFLPRTPDDLVFRGRVHQFASSVISVADKSAINMRGDYNDIKTSWDEEAPAAQEEGDDLEAKPEGDGDVQMEEDGKTEKPTESEDPETDFYSTLWSLQQYFAHPPSLDGATGDASKTQFQLFREKTDFILPRLFDQTQKERIMAGKADESGAERGHKRKRGQVEQDLQPKAGFKHPRYLTGKRLLEHELADPSFRRQILVQYFILFQFLLNLTPASVAKQAFTGGMPKTFVVNAEDETWVKSKISSIREELKRMVPDGQRFEETVLSIITRERHYAQWKNDGCPESVFELPPMDKADAAVAAEKWRKRLAPPPRWPFKVGTKSLSRMWQGGYTDISQLKGWKRAATVDSLDNEIGAIEMDEEDDAAMGRETPADQAAENREKKTSLNWRALRLASQTDLKHFAALQKKREIKALRAAKREEEERAEALKAGKTAGMSGANGGEKEDAGDKVVGEAVQNGTDGTEDAEGDGDGEDDVEGLKREEPEGETEQPEGDDLAGAAAATEPNADTGDDPTAATEEQPEVKAENDAEVEATAIEASEGDVKMELLASEEATTIGAETAETQEEKPDVDMAASADVPIEEAVQEEQER